MYFKKILDSVVVTTFKLYFRSCCKRSIFSGRLKTFVNPEQKIKDSCKHTLRFSVCRFAFTVA